MQHAKRTTLAGGALYLVVALLGIWPPSALHAQSKSTATPAAAPFVYDPEFFKMPQPMPDDGGKAGFDKFPETKPDFAIPGSIGLGKYQLHLDTDRKASDLVPKGDENDSANRISGMPARKDSPLVPGYFGLKLRTPTH
jgi:hypothetical protein